MKKILLGLVASVCLVASIAYATSIYASGTGPSMSQKGTAYILTLSPTGAPAVDTQAGAISWNWNVSPGMCIDGIGVPYACPLPSGFRVRLCWHTDADGIFFINPNTPDQCKTVTSQKSGTTTQWSSWLFNSGAKRLRMKLVFDASGSGSISPVIGTSGDVTVNF